MKLLLKNVTIGLLGLAIISLSPPVFAQTVEETIFVNYEQEPQFTGGMKALSAYLRQSVRYPKHAAKEKISGRVFTSFVIDTVGCISQICILIGLGYGCDEEAIRVVEQMPRWKPGQRYGPYARMLQVKYNLPILFPPEKNGQRP